MAQLNLYVTESLASDLKQRADRRGVSLSGYVVRLLKSEEATTPSDGWPQGFFEERCGFLKDEIVPPLDPAPEPVQFDEP